MLSNRWSVLALLFGVRCAMGIQFQSVPAVSPLYLTNFALTLADLGSLIGLYFAPGIFLALPGGALGQKFGEKRLVIVGLGLMAIGSLMMALGSDIGMLIAGRVISGVGGILMNVLMSKMVTDWFTGKEIATAMAIFVDSWPLGIALALIVLPPLANSMGLPMSLVAVAVYAIIGMLLIAAAYSPPAHHEAAIAAPASAARNTARLPSATAAWPRGAGLAALITAGSVWGLYNAALVMVFSFGPTLLGERGIGMVAASATTSIALWSAALSVPLGGVIADRTGRHNLVMIFGFISFAALLAWAARSEADYFIFCLIGLLGGVSAGPIMGLPSRILSPTTRSVGMGLFFTVFYGMQLTAPAIAGVLAKASGSARSAFDFGTLMLLACCLLLALFHLLRRLHEKAKSVQV